MIIFKDFVSGDEMFSDTFKMTLVDGFFYEVEGKITSRKSEGISDALIGGNASAEGAEADEGVEEGSVRGVDIVLNNRLVETGFKNKKEYQGYMKTYMKKIIEKLQKSAPDKLEAFKAAAKVAVKKMLDKFADLEFFMGESCDAEAMHAILWYNEDDTPLMYFIKEGLEEEKV